MAKPTTTKFQYSGFIVKTWNRLKINQNAHPSRASRGIIPKLTIPVIIIQNILLFYLISRCFDTEV